MCDDIEVARRFTIVVIDLITVIADDLDRAGSRERIDTFNDQAFGVEQDLTYVAIIDVGVEQFRRIRRKSCPAIQRKHIVGR